MTKLQDYLRRNGYDSLAEWGLDSGYEYNQQLDIWLDEYANVVNLRDQFYAATETSYKGEQQ